MGVDTTLWFSNWGGLLELSKKTTSGAARGSGQGLGAGITHTSDNNNTKGARQTVVGQSQGNWSKYRKNVSLKMGKTKQKA